MPRAWLSIDTTRSRRPWKIALFLCDEVLRPVQRLDRSPLRDGAGARGLLALDHVHRLDQLDRAGRIADAPAGHGIGFRHAVHGQRARVERRLDLGDRLEDEVAIGQVLVHVVGQHPDMAVLHQHGGQRLQLALGVGGARRVRRRVHHQPFGLRRDRLLQRGGRQLEAVVDRRLGDRPRCRRRSPPSPGSSPSRASG